MNMHHAEFGDYQMRNEVVGYEAGRRLAWEPARVAASAEEQEAIGDRPGTGGGTSSPPTAPVPPWSPSRSTAAVPRRTCARPSGDGEGWRDAMTASLARLELLAKAAGQRNQ
jgi:hypothetical protein